MATQLLSIGYPQAMVQNQIYALPARQTRLFTSDAAPTLQQSNDVAFPNNVAVTLVDGAAIVSGGFIRCTSGNITVALKAI